MSEEKRYTETEWKWKQIEDNLISSVRRAFMGNRIRTEEVLIRVLNEITQVIDYKDDLSWARRVIAEYFDLEEKSE